MFEYNSFEYSEFSINFSSLQNLIFQFCPSVLWCFLTKTTSRHENYTTYEKYITNDTWKSYVGKEQRNVLRMEKMKHKRRKRSQFISFISSGYFRSCAHSVCLFRVSIQRKRFSGPLCYVEIMCSFLAKILDTLYFLSETVTDEDHLHSL